ncbi:hypothetical protein [Paenibacillus thiaminolyticus]|uniref:Uncharacterized protein n=1 Tax=Paenibacillus thiaminolyticus TaxID=49283 RepID=A0A3A3GSR2_PANTH|nr:hypothetical protein [Paenibacillus thiaminolyticus]RJG26606.1 hypothetical protein DQX05_00790 [Paenibacillus thiaminolyticus]
MSGYERTVPLMKKPRAYMHGTHEYSWMVLGVASFPHLDVAPPYHSEGQFFPNPYICRNRLYGQTVKEEI